MTSTDINSQHGSDKGTEMTQTNGAEMYDMTELLEWRDHDSVSKITYTGFGPYMVERLSEDRFRAWLPDDSQSARLMVDGFTSDKEARAFCQRDLDGRSTLKFMAEAEAAFDADPEPAADDEAFLRRMRSAIPVARVTNDNQPGNSAIIEVFGDPPTLAVGTLLYAAPPHTHQ